MSFLFDDDDYYQHDYRYGQLGPAYDTTGTMFTSSNAQFDQPAMMMPSSTSYQPEFIDQSQVIWPRSKKDIAGRLLRAQDFKERLQAVLQTLLGDSRALAIQDDTTVRKYLVENDKRIESLLQDFVTFVDEESSLGKTALDILSEKHWLNTEKNRPNRSVLESKFAGFIKEVRGAFGNKSARASDSINYAASKLTMGSFRLLDVIFAYYIQKYEEKLSKKK